MADFTMPALGADMETGKVVQWLVRPGDRVRPGDVVAIVETHKGAIDVECFLDGVIDDLVAPETELPVGALLAHVHTASDARKAAPPPTTPVPSSAPVVPVVPMTPAATPVTAAAGPAARPKLSPAARRRAQELGLDAAALPGSGFDAAVTLTDVERAASRAGPPAGPATAGAPPRAPLPGFDPAQMRQAIAAAMARSKREIPHYYLEQTIDFAAASFWLEAYNRDREATERLLGAVLLLKATAQALVEVPQLNGWHVDGAFRPGPGVHVGWAISLRGGGLVAPAIHDVDRLALPDLMAALRDLVQRARSGRIRSSEMMDPTITVTSLGERGADRVFGVIYPPQVAIVGFGRIATRPWVDAEGGLVARPLVHASLAGDHRASDGHLGGQLLAAIDRALQAPDKL